MEIHSCMAWMKAKKYTRARVVCGGWVFFFCGGGNHLPQTNVESLPPTKPTSHLLLRPTSHLQQIFMTNLPLPGAPHTSCEHPTLPGAPHTSWSILDFLEHLPLPGAPHTSCEHLTLALNGQVHCFKRNGETTLRLRIKYV